MYAQTLSQTSYPAVSVIRTAKPALTFGDILEEEDFAPLDELIDAQLRGQLWGKCYSADFADDNHKHGVRALEYNVEVVTGRDYDGGANETDTVRVWVHVTPTMPLTTIVFLLTGEILALIDSFLDN